MPADNDRLTLTSVSRSRIIAIVLVYAIFAAIWILVSDRLIQRFFTEPDQIMLASMLKGWFYVAITSLLLYGLMRRWFLGNQEPKVGIQSSRRLLLPLAVLVTAIIALTATGIFYTLQQHEQEELGRIQAIAGLKARQIDDWLNERWGDADFIRTSELFVEQYQRWQINGDMQSAERLQLRLDQFRQSRRIFAISLLSPQGKRLWGSTDAPIELNAAVSAAAQLSTSRRQVQLVNPYRDGAGKVLLDFVVPLMAQPVSAPLVILHINLQDWLFPVLANWPVLSDSGETFLLRRDGDEVVYLSPLRFRPDAPLSLRLPINTQNLLASQAVIGEVKFGSALEGREYNNFAALGMAQAIRGTDWMLLTKLDKVEMYGKAKSEVVWIACVGCLTLFIACAGFYVLRQSQSLALVQAIQESQAERLRALDLLAAISDLSTDAIFAKDVDGRYILFNTAASNFVGVPIEEVLGKDDKTIFPQQQAEHLQEVGRRVMAENITLTQEETLDTQFGSRVFLATKGPLCDADGKVIGVFGISRDITQRKQAEIELRESEARFRGLVEQSLAGIYIIQDDRFAYVNPGFAAIFGYQEPMEIIAGKSVADLVSPKDRATVLENLRRRIDGEIRDLHYCFEGMRRDGQYIDLEVHGRSFEYLQRPAVIGFILDVSSRKATEDALSRQADELQARNEELERFNRAMVGRELDMIKLKQQVNALSDELGRLPPYTQTFLADAEQSSKPSDP